MNWDILFFVNSIALGVGLAMDAFSVSLANGLNEPDMKKGRMILIAGTFGFFQGLMPVIGWFCVHEIVEYFRVVEPFIPWVALLLLCYIGAKMIWEGSYDPDEEARELSKGMLFMQGIATSIDALSVGFAIVDYTFIMALVAAVIICMVTFIISMIGLKIGRRFGTRLAGKASIFGGVILILIGLEVVIKSFL